MPLLEGYCEYIPGTLEASVGQLSDLAVSLPGTVESAVAAMSQVLPVLDERLEPGT